MPFIFEDLILKKGSDTMDNTSTPKNRIICIKGRYYDTGTKNKSFLQVALDLKTLGVKEWYFMLEIKDPYLVNVDPFKTKKDSDEPDLTKDQISRITIECVHNIWYYLREVVRIPSAGSPEGVPYIANRGNIAQTWCLLHGLDSWLCLPRRTLLPRNPAMDWKNLFNCGNVLLCLNYQPRVVTFLGQRVTPEIW
jgi:hypothetical protein